MSFSGSTIFTRSNNRNNLFSRELERLGRNYTKILTDTTMVKYWTPVANLIDARRILKDGEFDLIHSHGYRADFLGALVARFTGLPIISTCHGYILTDRRLN